MKKCEFTLFWSAVALCVTGIAMTFLSAALIIPSEGLSILLIAPAIVCHFLTCALVRMID